MTTPATTPAVTAPPPVPGLPSDKLYPPVNAPRAGNVSPGVQPGTTPGVTLAQYVIVFGQTAGVFIYAGTPGLGNPPIYSMSNADADPYGNSVFPGIWAGTRGGIQVGFQVPAGGNFGVQLFPVPGTFTADAFIASIESNGGAVLQVGSAEDTGTGLIDRVVETLYDNLAGGGSAMWQLGYYDAGAVFNELADGTAAGLLLPAVSNISAVLPGTGTGPANPFQSETWHNITLDSGWTSVEQPQYRLLPGGNVQVAGQISCTATAGAKNINGSNPVPSAYWPSVTRIYRPSDITLTAGTVQMSTAGVFAMRASGSAFSANSAFLDGIYTL